MHHRASWRRMFIVLALVACSAALVSAQAVVKKPLSYDVYDGWKSIRGTEVSQDGTWLVYALVAEEGDGELVARNLKTGVEHRHPRGAGPGHHARRPVRRLHNRAAERGGGAGEAGEEEARGSAQERHRHHDARDRRGRRRRPGQELQAARGVVDRRGVPEGAAGQGTTPGGRRRPRRRPPRSRPAGRRRASTSRAPTSSSASSRPARRRPSPRSPSTRGTGTAAVSPTPCRRRRPRATARSCARPTARRSRCSRGKGAYTGLAFDTGGGELAFVSDRDAYDANPPTFKLYLWHASDRPGRRARLVGHRRHAGRLVGQRARRARLLEGRRPAVRRHGPTPRPAPADDAPEPVQVDVWNWKDPLLQPMQKVRADEERTRSYRAVVNLADRRFTQLATADMPEIRDRRRRQRRARRLADSVPAADLLGRQLQRLLRGERGRRLAHAHPREGLLRRVALAGSPVRRATSTTGTTTGTRTAFGTAAGRISPPRSACTSRARPGTRPASRGPTGWRAGRPATPTCCCTTGTTSGRSGRTAPTRAG